MTDKIHLTPPKQRIMNWVVASGLVLLFLISLHFLDLNTAQFMARFSNLPNILRLFMALDMTVVGEGLLQLLVSFALAICSLIIGGIISIALAFLAAENTAPSKIMAEIIKSVVSTIRAVPSLVLILFIVASIGLGYTSAVVSLTLSGIGYLTKAFTSTIEDQSSNLIETMRSTGANWFQIVVHGFFPNVLPSFLAWTSIRLEMSIAESISLGVIGAGGIGFMLSRFIRQHDHAAASTLILIIFLSMLFVEITLNIFKKKANA